MRRIDMSALTRVSNLFGGERKRRIEVLAGELGAARDSVTKLGVRLGEVQQEYAAEQQNAQNLNEQLEHTSADLRAAMSNLEKQTKFRAALEIRLTAARHFAARLADEIRLIKASKSWKLIHPMRAVSRGLRWLLRDTRRPFMLAWRLGTGRLRRTAKTSLPYYHRFVPLRVKALIPSKPRKVMKRQLKANAVTLSENAPPALKKAIADAEAASKAKDWPKAVRRWQAVLDNQGDNPPASAFAQLSRAHRSQGNLEKAEEIIQQGRATHPEYIGFTTEHAEILMARQEWLEAVKCWLSIVDTFGPQAESTVDDRIATACAGLLQSNEYERVITLIHDIKKRRGERLAFLAIEGIAYLRASRTSEAKTLLTEYWRRAQNDENFSHGLNLRPPPNVVETNFVTTTFRRDSLPYNKVNARICVYTALFGDYDHLHSPLYKPPEIDFICFSDRPRDVSGWDVRIVDPGTDHPVLQNRRVKILPYEYLADYDYSLYIDANVIFVGDVLIMIHHWLRDKPFVAWRHRERSDIYEECEAILAYFRHEPDAIIAEYEFFKQQQVPRHTGLITGRFLWRDHRDANVRELMENLWDHVTRFSRRDQPGLAYLMWKTSIRPELMPEHIGTVLGNEFFITFPHKTSMLELERAQSELRRNPNDARDVPPSPGVPCTNGSLCGQRRRRLTWIYRDKFKAVASTVMRGYQLSEIARHRLGEMVEVNYVNESQLDAQVNCTLILTKGFLNDTTLDELGRLKEAGNIVCVDYVDDVARDDLHEAVDVYIASSIGQFLYYLKKYPDKLVQLITHHADPLIDGVRGPINYCNIGYFGEMANARYCSELQGLIDFCRIKTVFVETSWVNRLRHCNVHYAVRNRRSFDGKKPFLKGFTAAQCHANIIVPISENDAPYYLGSDYPYVLKDDSLQSVTEMIDYVKESFGGREWQRGLEMMTSVRQRCSPAHVASEVKELVAK